MASSRVVVVGGGVSGLAAAYRIRETARRRGLSVEITLLESRPGVGGKIGSVREEGFLCETGPNGFLDNEPATLRLVDDLGLRDRLLRSRDVSRRRFLVRDGRLVEMHMHPVRFLRSPLLSRRAKLRMALEFFVRARRDGADESVGDFGRRRLGREFTEVMLDSMVSGIYAGDVDRLSVAAAFPKIVDLEREYGGLFRGLLGKQKERRRARRAAKAAAGESAAAETATGPSTGGTMPAKVEAGPGGVLHSFREGMGEAITALRDSLGPIVRCASPVAQIEAGPPHRLHLAEGDVVEADAIVLTAPAPASAQLLRGVADEAAAALAEIPVVGVHVVCLGFRHDQIAADTEAFGVLIPRKEGLRTLGAIFSSGTFEGRAPRGFTLLTCMIGGRHDPAADALDDEDLRAQVLSDMRPLLGLSGEPIFVRVFRWARGIPQYELGHLERVRRAREDVAQIDGIFLGGNAVAGVSFNHCIAHAETLGRQVCDHLATVGEDRAEEAAR